MHKFKRQDLNKYFQQAIEDGFQVSIFIEPAPVGISLWFEGRRYSMDDESAVADWITSDMYDSVEHAMQDC